MNQEEKQEYEYCTMCHICPEQFLRLTCEHNLCLSCACASFENLREEGDIFVFICDICKKETGIDENTIHYVVDNCEENDKQSVEQLEEIKEVTEETNTKPQEEDSEQNHISIQELEVQTEKQLLNLKKKEFVAQDKTEKQNKKSPFFQKSKIKKISKQKKIKKRSLNSHLQEDLSDIDKLYFKKRAEKEKEQLRLQELKEKENEKEIKNSKATKKATKIKKQKQKQEFEFEQKKLKEQIQKNLFKKAKHKIYQEQKEKVIDIEEKENDQRGTNEEHQEVQLIEEEEQQQGYEVTYNITENIDTEISKRSPWKEGSSPLKCSFHKNQKAVLICFTCNSKFLCLKCIIEKSHSHHNIQEPKSCAKMIKDNIQMEFSKIGSLFDQMLNYQQLLSDQQQVINNDFFIAKEKIHEEFSLLESMIKKKKSEVLEELEVRKQKKYQKIVSRKASIKTVVNEILQTKNSLSKLAKTKKSVQLSQIKTFESDKTALQKNIIIAKQILLKPIQKYESQLYQPLNNLCSQLKSIQLRMASMKLQEPHVSLNNFRNDLKNSGLLESASFHDLKQTTPLKERSTVLRNQRSSSSLTYYGGSNQTTSYNTTKKKMYHQNMQKYINQSSMFINTTSPRKFVKKTPIKIQIKHNQIKQKLSFSQYQNQQRNRKVQYPNSQFASKKKRRNSQLWQLTTTDKKNYLIQNKNFESSKMLSTFSFQNEQKELFQSTTQSVQNSERKRPQRQRLRKGLANYMYDLKRNTHQKITKQNVLRRKVDQLHDIIKDRSSKSPLERRTMLQNKALKQLKENLIQKKTIYFAINQNESNRKKSVSRNSFKQQVNEFENFKHRLSKQVSGFKSNLQMLNQYKKMFRSRSKSQFGNSFQD